MPPTFEPWLLLATVALFLAASCDLPVRTIDKGVVEQRPETNSEAWASAYGFSATEWQVMVNGSQYVEEHLRLLLEKGQQDWDDELLEELVLELHRKLRRSAKRRHAVQHVVKEILRNQRLGELLGNRQMLEATSSYYILGFDAPTSGMSVTQDVQSLRGLNKAFGIFSERHKACLRSELTQLTPEDLCRKCLEFWSCAESPKGDKLVVRVSLEAPRRTWTPGSDLSLGPSLPGVKILETGSGKIFRKDLMHELLKMFPNVRVLTFNVAPNDDNLAYPHFDAWATKILALHMHAPMSSSVVQMVCQLRSLRYLTFGGVEASNSLKVNLQAFPECIGNLSQLLHLKVVGCNLTGTESLPASLSNLRNLKIFEAFEQGRLHSDDEYESTCPGPWVPQRSSCVPGYVARADGAAPVWRCPVHGWNLRMDDMSLPWWGWKSIEKMHIDANFIHGTIPENLPELWPKLRSLDLHDMNLTGPLPVSLTSLENLTQLQVQLNDLHCPEGVDVVSRLARRPKMRVLHVDANPRMCGCLPELAPSFLHLQVGETSVQLGCRDHEDL